MIPLALAQRLQRLAATPRRRLAVMAAVATLVGLILVTALWTGPRWTVYELAGTGLEVELPVRPETARSGAAEAKVPLFQVHCPELAVVASGGPIPDGSTPDVAFLARQAMAQVQMTPGITELDYRVGTERLNGQNCLMVGGAFRRDGVPSRLSGAFLLTPAGHGHVLCFWSDPKGARMANRVLRSVRLAR